MVPGTRQGPPLLVLFSWYCDDLNLFSEDGGQFPGCHHDGGACRGRRAGSQDSAQSSSQTHVQVPHTGVPGSQGGRRTPPVTFTRQTRQGAHAHTCQVGGASLYVMLSGVGGHVT